MVSLGSLDASDHVQHIVWLKWLLDPWLVPAGRRGPAGLETSLGLRERDYNKKPLTDVNIIGFEQSLLLFLCGRETSSETRMKFQPYLRECMWVSGMQQEKRASAFSGFLLLSPCAKDNPPHLNFKVFWTLLGFEMSIVMVCLWCCFLCLPVAIHPGQLCRRPVCGVPFNV